MDRITELSVDGMRTLADVRIALNPLTVLIGENGTGKTSLLEALELLRRSTEGTFVDAYQARHRGDAAVLRSGAAYLTIGVLLEGANDAPPVRYSLSFSGQLGVVKESLVVMDGSLSLIDRTSDKASVRLSGKEASIVVGSGVGAGQTVLSRMGLTVHPAAERVRQALESIEVQLPFDTTAGWTANRDGEARRSPPYAPAARLERFGGNIANIYSHLKNGKKADWEETLDLIRLGLGDWCESVNTRPDPGGGLNALWVKRRHVDREIPAVALSDGQLAFLCFVGLMRLPRARSILCFDEPELHLHPQMLARVLAMVQTLVKDSGTTVLLATHSQRLLDALGGAAEAAASVRVLDLDPDAFKTEVRTLEPVALGKWMEVYSAGVGGLVDSGFLSTFLRDGGDA